MPSTSTPPKEPPTVLSGDFRNLRTHGAASLEELKEFLGTLRGKSPQEVIGIVSSSMLIQSVALATGITFVTMVVFTVGPYLIWGPPKAKPAEAPAAAATPAVTPAAPAATAAKTPGEEKKKSSGPSEEDTAKATKAMGMDEVKSADPKANPREKELDNILDGTK
jgi:hypothetical protein